MGEPRTHRLALILGALCALVGAGGVVASWGAFVLDRSIEAHGPRAVAHVTGKSRGASTDGDYDIAYSFRPPGGQRVDAVRGVSRELWGALSNGDTVVVAYSASSPTRNFPLGEGVTSLSVTLLVSVLSAIFAGCGGLLILGAFRRRPD
jgi:hypothetical protein